MAIDHARLKARTFADQRADYDWKDSIHYALGVGYGLDPTDQAQLRFVYEQDQLAVPTMAVVLATPGFWVKEADSGVDWVRVLHGEQSLELHRPLPVSGSVIGRNRVVSITDKGAGRGALLVQRRTLHDAADDSLIATLEQVTFARGDGGFSERPGNGPAGGDPAPTPRPAVPTRPPDLVCDLPTSTQSALLYRLCADLNPLHADPVVATAAGFERPILHGLASFGVAAHAILRSCCDYDPARLAAIGLRFSAPVYPGETLSTEIWRDGDDLSFQTRVVERDRVVLSHGTARLRPLRRRRSG